MFLPFRQLRRRNGTGGQNKTHGLGKGMHDVMLIVEEEFRALDEGDTVVWYFVCNTILFL